MRWLGAALVAGGWLLTGTGGCSSGSSSTSPPADSGAGADTTEGDSGGPTPDSGSPLDSATSDTSAPTPDASDAGGDAGNHSFGTATPITAGAGPVSGTLASATTGDFYSFTGVAGHRIEVRAVAQGLVTTSGHDPFDPTVINTVAVLYTSDMQTVWASDDDGWPRLSTDSTVFAELPSSGTFYLAVEDCHAYAQTHATVQCAPAAGITDFAYQVSLRDLTASSAEVVGSASSTATITYSVPQGNQPGQYGAVVLDGDFAQTSDHQVFQLTPPADTQTSATARPRAFFWVQPVGPTDGDGTALDVVAFAEDGASNVLGQVDEQYFDNGDDATNGPMRLSLPITLGTTLTFHVTVSSNGTIAATKSYYIIDHAEGALEFGIPEAEGPLGSGMNDTPATAQTLSADTSTTGEFAVDGNCSSPTDVDWFSIAVPSGSHTATLQCRAARDGSGLQGFTATLYGDSSGTTQLGAVGPEASPPTTDLSSAALSLGSATTLTLKVAVSGQSATIAGTYYRCGVALK